MKSSLTDSQLVNEWSGTIAQLRCNVSLRDIVNSEHVPTLTDVNACFGNSTSVKIITEHLQSVLQFSGVELDDTPLAETALAILSSYWFLNLAELCIFFSQLKAGSRGQFVWGSKINNQAIMVALNDFCRDRRVEIEAIETQKARERKELFHSRIENAAAAIVSGVDQFHKMRDEAKESLSVFCELYPYLPERYSPETWWEAWRGEKGALTEIYGDSVPPREKAIDDISLYLSNYNIEKAKERSTK